MAIAWLTSQLFSLFGVDSVRHHEAQSQRDGPWNDEIARNPTPASAWVYPKKPSRPDLCKAEAV